MFILAKIHPHGYIYQIFICRARSCALCQMNKFAHLDDSALRIFWNVMAEDSLLFRCAGWLLHLRTFLCPLLLLLGDLTSVSASANETHQTFGETFFAKISPAVIKTRNRNTGRRGHAIRKFNSSLSATVTSTDS